MNSIDPTSRPPRGTASGHARVETILRSPREGAPMEELDEVRIRAGKGLEGDRYGRGEGRWSDHRWEPVTLVAREDAEAAAAALDVAVDPSSLRRNLVTRGVDLNSLVGCTFEVGEEVILEGVRPCDPCRYLEGLLEIPGLKEALRGRGGLRARVVREGVVRRGDRVRRRP